MKSNKLIDGTGKVLIMLFLIIIFSTLANAISNITIDHMKPTIVSTFNEPINENSIITRLLFNKTIPIPLEKKFFSGDYMKVKYKVISAIDEGCYNYTIQASDLLGNLGPINKALICVKTGPLRIIMIDPKHLVSDTNNYDIVIETNRLADCRYELNQNRTFDSLSGRFNTIDGIVHTATGFLGPSTVYIRCKDLVNGKERDGFYKILVDTTPPTFKSLIAKPNPVIEETMVRGVLSPSTSIIAELDEDSICKFSPSISYYPNMTYFSSDDPDKRETYGKITIHNATRLVDKVNYTYNVICENLAGLISSTSKVAFTVNLGQSIISNFIFPTDGYMTSNASISIRASTSKHANCMFYEDNNTIAFATTRDSVLHNLPPKQFSNGIHKVQMKCSFVRGVEGSFASVSFTVDTTPPTSNKINSSSNIAGVASDKTYYLDRLYAKWDAQDSESGIKRFFVRIMKKDGTALKNWTDMGASRNNWFTGLRLVNGDSYYFEMQAENRVGLKSLVVTSYEVKVDTSLKPEGCDDNKKNLEECDVDCGGSCKACIIGKKCSSDSCCASGYCSPDNKCAEESCTDVWKNGDETDINCGGNRCDACENGQACDLNSDCISKNCEKGICKEKNIELDQQECQFSRQCSNGLVCYLYKCVVDNDGDKMADSWEVSNTLDPVNPQDGNFDPDKDLWLNLYEFRGKTNPNLNDSDNDKWNDYEEILVGTDPNTKLSLPKNKSKSCKKTNDCLNGDLCFEGRCAVDTDKDGMPNIWEIMHDLNPNSDDSQLDYDNDKLNNVAEYNAKTDPDIFDSDRDGMPDGWELQNGLNPLVDDLRGDPDIDDLTNLEEYNMKNTWGKSTNPKERDSDGDGWEDKIESNKGKNPTDSSDHPTSYLWLIIILIVTIIILAVGGYFGYNYYMKSKSSKSEINLPSEEIQPQIEENATEEVKEEFPQRKLSDAWQKRIEALRMKKQGKNIEINKETKEQKIEDKISIKKTESNIDNKLEDEYVQIDKIVKPKKEKIFDKLNQVVTEGKELKQSKIDSNKNLEKYKGKVQKEGFDVNGATPLDHAGKSILELKNMINNLKKTPTFEDVEKKDNEIKNKIVNKKVVNKNSNIKKLTKKEKSLETARSKIDELKKIAKGKSK